MAHTSEVRSPTNSDPATTAEQAEEDTQCSQRLRRRMMAATGRQPLVVVAHHATRLWMSSCEDPCGWRRRIDILTLKDNTRRRLRMVQQQSHAAIEEWQRGQACDIWESFVADLHIGGGSLMVAWLLGRDRTRRLLQWQSSPRHDLICSPQAWKA